MPSDDTVELGECKGRLRVAAFPLGLGLLIGSMVPALASRHVLREHSNSCQVQRTGAAC